MHAICVLSRFVSNWAIHRVTKIPMLAAALIDHNVHGPVQALRWDVATNCYEVIDGGLFERRFDELRRKRDRDDGSNGRPFSRMHKYYKLAVGERWAKTVKLHVASALHYYACCQHGTPYGARGGG